MTVSAALQRQYASAVQGTRIRECLVLSHPRFSKIWRLTTEQDGFSAADENGVTVRYEPGPIAVVPTGQDASGRGNAGVQIAASPEVVQELVAASAGASQTLTLTYHQYLTGSTSPDWTQSLEVIAAEVDPERGVIVADAAMPDLEAMAFPRAKYRVDRFPGLDRR